MAHLLVSLPSAGGQCLQQIVDGFTLLRQKDGHAIGIITIGQTESLTIIRLRIVELVLLMHHGNLLLHAIAFEGLLLRVALVELLCPGTLEVDGIQQITDGRGVEVVFRQHLLDHLLCMVATPLIDDIASLSIAKVACLGLSIVIGLGLADEISLQLVAFVHINGVGYHHLRQFIQRRCLGEHLLTESIDPVCASISEA